MSDSNVINKTEHLAKSFTGLDIKQTPTNTQGDDNQLCDANMTIPSDSLTPGPTDYFNLVPILQYTENSPQVTLFNLRHIARSHGYDITLLHPDIFAPVAAQDPSQTLTQPRQVSSPQEVIASTVNKQSILDKFEMGNDVGRNDPVLVAREGEATSLHGVIAPEGIASPPKIIAFSSEIDKDI